jgi:hypothetical protein
LGLNRARIGQNMFVYFLRCYFHSQYGIYKDASPPAHALHRLAQHDQRFWRLEHNKTATHQRNGLGAKNNLNPGIILSPKIQMIILLVVIPVSC